mgnify:CR=1 FL=1
MRIIKNTARRLGHTVFNLLVVLVQYFFAGSGFSILKFTIFALIIVRVVVKNILTNFKRIRLKDIQVGPFITANLYCICLSEHETRLKQTQYRFAVIYITLSSEKIYCQDWPSPGVIRVKYLSLLFSLVSCLLSLYFDLTFFRIIRILCSHTQGMPTSQISLTIIQTCHYHFELALK